MPPTAFEMPQPAVIRAIAVMAHANRIAEALSSMKAVSGVDIYSPEEAYEYLSRSTSNINYLEKIPKDFFPSFLEVHIDEEFRNPINVRRVEREIIKHPEVDVASYGEKWIEHFSKIRASLRLFMILLTGLLTASVSFIIFNTIRLSLFRYKSDIKIFSLVGATRSFIELPYLISSMIEITVSFLLSLGLVTSTMYILNDRLLRPVELNFLAMPDTDFFIKIYIYLLVVTIISGKISVTSFLKKVKSINES